MSYTIYTQRIGGNGTTYNQEFKCKDYNKDKGIIEFWNDLGEHWYLSIHKFDYVQVKQNPEEKPHGY